MEAMIFFHFIPITRWKPMLAMFEFQFGLSFGRTPQSD
jgi:hypothetical protein